MWADMDPRSKMFIALCLSSMALILRHYQAAVLLVIFCLLAFYFFGVEASKPARLIARLAPALFFIGMLQISLIKTGEVLWYSGNIRMVTTGGILAAVSMAVRVWTIASCGFIIGSIGFSDFLLAMKAMHVPYELSFMSAMGAKFLPLLSEEMRDSLISAQLRGANLVKMGIADRFRLYSQVLMPATVTALMRAEQVSWALELKGFDPGSSRTYWRRLDMGTSDWMAFPIAVVALALFLVANYAF